jgi:hypothetical protein
MVKFTCFIKWIDIIYSILAPLSIARQPMNILLPPSVVLPVTQLIVMWQMQAAVKSFWAQVKVRAYLSYLKAMQVGKLFLERTEHSWSQRAIMQILRALTWAAQKVLIFNKLLMTALSVPLKM